MPFGLCYAEYIELISLSPSQHFSLKSWKLRGKVVSLPTNSNIASTTLQSVSRWQDL